MQTRAEVAVGEKAIESAEELALLELVRRQSDPESGPWTRCALSYWSQKRGSATIGFPKWKHSVVVLFPPWVMTTSASGRSAGCGRTRAPHVVREVELRVLWALGDDDPVRRAGEHVDQPLHQLDVRGAEAAERRGRRAHRRPTRCAGSSAESSGASRRSRAGARSASGLLRR